MFSVPIISRRTTVLEAFVDTGTRIEQNNIVRIFWILEEILVGFPYTWSVGETGVPIDQRF
jgi:hypothetical protein